MITRQKKFDPKSPIRHITQGRKETFRIHPKDISIIPGFNARKTFDHIEDLAESMYYHGQELPVTVRPTGEEDRPLEIINGERRLRAARHINQHLDPDWCLDCKIKPKKVKPLDLLLSQLIANEGVPFSFLEKAELTRRILNEDSSLKPADIARHSGESKQAISDQLTLIDKAATEILEAVRANTLAATTAVKIVRHHPEDPQAQLAELNKAKQHASENHRDFIKPRDLPAPPTKTPTEPQENESQSTEKSDPDPADTSTTPHPSPPPAPDPEALKRIKDAPSTNRDGSSPGPKNDGQYVAPDKRLKQLDQLLEKISKSDHNEERLTTVELVIGYIENTRTAQELRKHLSN